jgi:hypothetical protein
MCVRRYALYRESAAALGRLRASMPVTVVDVRGDKGTAAARIRSQLAARATTI